MLGQIVAPLGGGNIFLLGGAFCFLSLKAFCCLFIFFVFFFKYMKTTPQNSKRFITN